MKHTIKKILFGIIDIILIPVNIIFLPILGFIRKYGVQYFPLQRRLFLKMGVFPIRDHYYEPQLIYSKDFDAKKERSLHLDLNIVAQLSALSELEKYQSELGTLRVHDPSFGAGDAELYYLLIRDKKPKRIIEIGSGFSTLLARKAIEKNSAEGFATTLTCIEPYEKKWLDNLSDIQLIRKPVEQLPVSFFQSLGENDILFIDSSHIIRPENDVLFEYLELLPSLQKGVLIHVHDIFSPRHYRQDWLTGLYRFWNEQYLLEAFLYYNDSFRVIFSVNYLKNNYYDALKKTCVHLRFSDEPASFWMQKTA